MSVYEETQAILNTYKIQANKSLGQNFLIDDCVIEIFKYRKRRFNNRNRTRIGSPNRKTIKKIK